MNPLASQPSANTTASSSSAAAALKGASLAFQKKPPAPPPKPKDNGALTAATSVGRPRSPMKQQQTGESDAEIAARIYSPGQLYPGFTGGSRVDPKSPSFIAATLAASRSASPTPKAKTPRKESFGAVSSSSGEVVDSVSIPPTGSLISMFEQARAGGGDPVKRPSPKRSPMRSPVESMDEILDVRDVSPMKTPMMKPKPKLKPKPRPISPPPQIISRSTPEVLSPKPKRMSKPKLRPVTPPQIVTRAPTQELLQPSPDPPKRSPKPRERPPTPPKPRGSTKPVVKKSSTDQGHVVKPKPKDIKPQISGQRTSTPARRRTETSGSVSSDDTFVSASSAPSPGRPSPPPQPRNMQPSVSLPASPTREAKTRNTAPTPPRPRRTRPTNSSTSNLPLDSLTNAIMAGSLASSRLTPHNTGGSLSAPPLPKRQKSPRLMQTLRQPAKMSGDEADKHKKGHISKKLNKGKHSHHEGSRRKWREEITPRERKRYEAVWASNRGVLVDYHDRSLGASGEVPEYVVNIVVREIWKRSRLPMDELAEVWDLVDRQGRGMLGRQEFVVGMWLVDQRLRGRKIPAKVSDSVWGSANGMKVINPRVK
ncbi:Fc.00g007140.m01.CDS01 [Cosmosporella sp. VM-42]